MDILAVNCGSSSVKYQLYDWKKREVIATTRSMCTGLSPRLRFAGEHRLMAQHVEAYPVLRQQILHA